MPEILLATHNPGKVREIRRITAGLGWQWRSLDDFPEVPPATEDASTFAENARQKALHYAAATGLPTLADDSGLEVDCLGGAPGVHSARYAGSPRDDAANNRKLVAALAGVPLERRAAHFRCAMALAQPIEKPTAPAGKLKAHRGRTRVPPVAAEGKPGGTGVPPVAGEVLAETEGVVEGLIQDEPRGDRGFGYDPHFLLPDRNKTMAELPPDEKNAISHRGQALRAMLPKIAEVLGSDG